MQFPSVPLLKQQNHIMVVLSHWPFMVSRWPVQWVWQVHLSDASYKNSLTWQRTNTIYHIMYILLLSYKLNKSLYSNHLFIHILPSCELSLISWFPGEGFDLSCGVIPGGYVSRLVFSALFGQCSIELLEHCLGSVSLAWGQRRVSGNGCRDACTRHWPSVTLWESGTVALHLELMILWVNTP